MHTCIVSLNDHAVFNLHMLQLCFPIVLMYYTALNNNKTINFEKIFIKVRQSFYGTEL